MTTSPTRVRVYSFGPRKPAVAAPVSDSWQLLPGDDHVAGPTEFPGISMTSRRLGSSIAVVRVYGEIDASNANDVTQYALTQSAGCRGLILDLGGVKFFATEGFSALLHISVNCARRGAVWAVVPGAFASRVLQICDPESSLPRADTVIAALRTCTDQLHDRPELISSGTDLGR